MHKLLMFLLIFILQCDHTNEPSNDTLIFSNMEVTYQRYGGWIDGSALHIDRTGSVEALLIGHASGCVVDSAFGNISEDLKTKFERIFAPFSEFDSYYRPADYYTDGEIHIIVLTYRSEPDTVFVYEPENSIIPIELNIMIAELYDLWENLIFN